ncbi:MAG: hypothetical protein Q7T93_17780 [Methylobacterium sp.]|uniref:hypothetical protein n=1 Tax=Methylobacterium sp. TaxID=409 RepID=UPI002718FA0A|nr:hypothetical protein [Methylobacterium sp.]MDO9428665.1 hypothetical protein [Methylobacterium sp.]
MKRITAASAKRKCVPWAPWEDAHVIVLHPDYGALLRELPNRTYAALRQRARHLGIVRPRHVWTIREVECLRKASTANLRSRDIAKLFPKLRPTQILAKARHLNLSRGQRLKDFDDPVLSAIRARASQMNLTLSDLDKRARSGRYFQKSDRNFHLRHAASAVAALDGRISVKWDDI